MEKQLQKLLRLKLREMNHALKNGVGSELGAAIGSDVEVEWVAASASDSESGIVAVHVMTPNDAVRLD